MKVGDASTAMNLAIFPGNVLDLEDNYQEIMMVLRHTTTRVVGETVALEEMNGILLNQSEI